MDGNDIHDNWETGLSGVAKWIHGCIPRQYSSVGPHVTRNRFRRNGTGMYFHGVPAASSATNDGNVFARIENNLVIASAGPGLLLKGNFDGAVLNNSILGNQGAGVSSDLNLNGAPALHNNLIAKNGQGVRVERTFTNQVRWVSHNNVFANGADWVNYPAEFGDVVTQNPKGTPSDIHMNLSVDPMFVAEDDYHLDPESPLVNAGTVLEAPKGDFEGDHRLNVPDIGCDETPYEFKGIVTTLADENDGFLGWGTGDSLREVMLAAARMPERQTITFAEALRGGTIVLAGTQLPTITGSLSIAGLGAGSPAIDAGGRSRVFEIAPGGTASIGDLTLRAGRSGSDTHGGALYSRGQAVVRKCIFESCQATGGGGGALANVTGQSHLTVESCVFNGNWGLGSGGALLNGGIAVVRDSVFEGNSTSSDGGAIANYGNLSVERCMLHGNHIVGRWPGREVRWSPIFASS